MIESGLFSTAFEIDNKSNFSEVTKEIDIMKFTDTVEMTNSFKFDFLNTRN